MKTDSRPIIGITMGDAAGIGPEIIVKALSLEEIYEICRPIVIGDASVLDNIQKIARTTLEVRPVRQANKALFAMGTVDILDLHKIDRGKLKMGEPQAMAGEASYSYIEKATHLAISGALHGIVTAPISKEALHMAGHHYAGHTEILASQTKTREYAMAFVAGTLRVILVTVHVSLREACDLVTRKRVLATIRLGNDLMQRLGKRTPRIAVAGLNPHAGENRLFGNEDDEEIKPAISDARSLGLSVEGPLPADTVFFRAKNGEFDIVVAQYHDQGCIPIKLLGFNLGVNLTVGLPIIRTSVDHGTAFRRAGLGLGTGDPSSLIEAIKLASQLASRSLALSG
jgi:4-hydroxythreonine-4-phosphate dehydrogenase